MGEGPVARRWVRAEVDSEDAARLGAALGVSSRAGRLLVARGIRDPDAGARYLKPELEHLPDPFLMKGVERAALRLADALEHAEPVTLYADYDVDGVTSASLLAAFLEHHGLTPRIYIPKRLIEGYGLNREAVERIAAEGARVLVTLDCGITAQDEIARANALGLDCIVVDHHRCPPELPPAYATLNPHQLDCSYPDKVLAAVGVCFNLVIALRKILRGRGAYAAGARGEPNLRRFMDLVALGTIADMVPLTGVNRVLAWFGVQELRLARRAGVRALMEVSKVKPARARSGDVGFRLGPRINAAGRLDDAAVGVRLLLSVDMSESRRLAEALDAANASRQRIEGEVFRDAVARIDAMGELPAALVLASESWHPGVVGIVCTKLVERYDRPAILVGEGGRGSARTAMGLPLYDMIADCAHHLTKFGGHRAAAGLRMPFARVDAFREDFVARVVRELEEGGRREPSLLYDDDLAPEEIDDHCLAEVQRLEPFGIGNPEPLFRVDNLRVRTAHLVGGEHLKLRLERGPGGPLTAIAFRRKDLHADMTPGAPIDLTCHLEMNEFAGWESLELRVKDLRTR